MNEYQFVTFLLAGIFNRANKFYAELISQIEAIGGRCIPIDHELKKAQFTQKPDKALGKLSFYDEAQYIEKKIKKELSHTKPNTKIIIIGHSKGALHTLTPKINALTDLSIFLTPALPQGYKRVTWNSILPFVRLLPRLFYARNSPVRRSFRGTKRGVFNKRMSKREMREKWKNLYWESFQIIRDLAGGPFSSTQATKIAPKEIKSDGLIIVGEEDVLIKLTEAKRLAEDYNLSTKSTFDFKSFSEVSHYLFWGKQGETVMNYITNYIQEWLEKTSDPG